MKKLFTLLAAASMALSIAAKDYTDQLTVTVNGVSSVQTATISVDDNSNGTYNFNLKNFILEAGGQKMPVGNITINNVKGSTDNGKTTLKVNQNVKITAGDIPGVDSWMGTLLPAVPVNMVGELQNGKLYAVINIDMATLRQTISCVFGNGGYQIPNSDFEEYRNEYVAKMDMTTGLPDTLAVNEPLYWHSFASAGGEYAAAANSLSAPHTDTALVVRPGSTGKKSLRLTSSLVFGYIVANGTITTGRMNAGDGFDPASTKNNAYMCADSTATDSHGDRFYTEMNGKPDSIAVWLAFKQGTPNAEHPYATISAAITDGTYYQDPQDTIYNNKMAVAQDRQIATTYTDGAPVWKRIVVPFNYYDNGVNGKAILVTISTNADAAQGSLDTLYVDDLELIYNSKLADLKYKGNSVEGFNADSLNYTVQTTGEVNANDIVALSDGNGATVETVIEKTDNGCKATITVTSNDLKHSTVYTINFVGGTVSGINSVANNHNDSREVYTIDGIRVRGNNAGRGVYIIKENGKTSKAVIK